MEWEQRNLDAEADQQTAHQNQLTAHSHLRCENRPDSEINASCDQSDAQESRQDQNTGHRGDDQELGGCIGPIGTAPDGDEQPERDQFKFVEQEEQKQVLGQKRPVHSAADHQQKSEINAGAVFIVWLTKI